jgi:Peptidase_C39 like family
MPWASIDSPTPPDSFYGSTDTLSMPTDLFTLVDGMEAAALTGTVPPACRRGVDGGQLSVRAETAILESPTWTPRHAVRHLVPSFSLLNPVGCSFRFEVSAFSGGSWTPWVATATIGPAVFPDEQPQVPKLLAEIDTYAAPQPLEHVRLRVRVQPARALSGPWVVALSASDLGTVRPVVDHARTATVLDVPPLSQRDEEPAIQDRICSPTCVAMVLAFWGRRVSITDIAAEVFHAGLDRYGVWPAAIHAAARRGVAGYLLRFPDWASAAWCLGQGLPVIASIRFEAGELEGTPLARSDGHLVVLTGEEGDHVLVNDPAAASSRDVPRRYRREEFCRAWLERSGVGYVLFAP